MRSDLSFTLLIIFAVLVLNMSTISAKSALIVVDVQNDFIDGTLSLKACPSKHDGSEVVPVINELIRTTNFNTIAYTLDWHTSDHISFIENCDLRKLCDRTNATKKVSCFDTVRFEKYPNVEQKMWPAHCIQNTWGAETHKSLKMVDPKTDELKRKVLYAKKGTNSDIDSYSAFFNTHGTIETNLHDELQKNSITDLYVCGLAYDVCVFSTAMDALKLKYHVFVVDDACRGVDVASIEDRKAELVKAGAVIVESKQVIGMVNSKENRSELTFTSLGTKAEKSSVPQI